MTIFIESGSGFAPFMDVYGHEITGSGDSTTAVAEAQKTLHNHPDILDNGRKIIVTPDIRPYIETAASEDLLISLHINFFRDPRGEGLRGYYRSTRHINSEYCKGLAITLLKAAYDHLDLYYHGVYNEQRFRHPALNAIIAFPGLAAIIEVGLSEKMKDKLISTAISLHIGQAVAKGILRYLNADHCKPLNG